jgi:aminoglycoside phosphotransferase (APT) family kinase protein
MVADAVRCHRFLGPHRRWILVNAVIVTAGINVVVNGGIAGVSIIGADAVPVWAIPLLGGPSILTDTVATLFTLPLITCLLSTTAVWQELRTGRLTPLRRLGSVGPLGRLPAGRLRRGFVFGACSTVLLAPPVTVAIVSLDFGALGVGDFVVYKVAFAVGLGVLITPVIALRAMADAPDPEDDRESRLLASGRHSDVYELGRDRVLRRTRDAARMPPWEPEVMRLARAHGVPVPEVFDVDGLDMIMARVHGPTMLEDLPRRPWRLRAHARTLAELHRSVHRVPAPATLPAPFGEGDRLLHLDLHPANVIISRDGPMLIDWQGSVRGPAAADLAHTYLLLVTSTVPGPRLRTAIARSGQALFAAAFRTAAGPVAIDAYLRPVAERRLTDSSLLPEEAQRIRRLLSAIA